MTREKQVSVRFSAVGGNATKAEMRGIGLAGREAMQEIGQSATIAESGIEHISAAALKARMDLEAMATKAMRESMNMRATIPAESAVQARIMQSTGVTNQTGMSASETLRQGQALDDLRAKLNPLYAEIRRYRQAVSEVRAAELEGAITTEEAAAAKGRLRTASLQAIDGLKGISAANREAARAAEDAAMATAREAQAMDDLRARYNPVYAATRQYKAALADLNRLKERGVISSQEYTDAIDREGARMRANIAMNSAAVQQMARASRGATLRMQQMFYQVNDIGVSLAGGMNPFLVMAQQGTQIAQIYSFGGGGVGGIFKDLSKMITSVLTRIPLLTAAVAAGAVAFGGLKAEINSSGKEVVSMGDTAKAVFQVIGGYIFDFIKPAVDKISGWFSAAWDKVVTGVKWLGNALINGVRIMVEGIRLAITAIPAYFEMAWESAKMFVYHSLADMLAGLGRFLTDAANGINSVFGTNLSGPKGIFDAAARANKDGNDAAATAAAAGNRGDAAFDLFDKRSNEIANSDPMGDFFDDVAKQARENARNRKKKDKKGGSSETDEVQKLVDALQQELSVLRETDPIKAKMLEYSEQLAEATGEERKEVFDLVVALDKAKNGWEAVTLALGNYAEDAKRIGDDIAGALTGAFQSAEQAVGDFVKTGKLSFTDLITSLIADLAQLSTRKFILGPLSSGLDAALGGLGGGGGFFANFAKGFNNYEGGGHTGYAPRSGGVDGKGGFLALMHPRERVWDEAKGTGMRGPGGMGERAPQTINVIQNIQTPDAHSFRRSRAQLGADAQRMVAMGRRTS